MGRLLTLTTAFLPRPLPSLQPSQPGRGRRLLWDAAMACPTQETQPTVHMSRTAMGRVSTSALGLRIPRLYLSPVSGKRMDTHPRQRTRVHKLHGRKQNKFSKANQGTHTHIYTRVCVQVQCVLTLIPANTLNYLGFPPGGRTSSDVIP